MKIAAVACGNGLGHVKRLIRVLGRVRSLEPAGRVHLFCERWQTEALAAWAEYRALLSWDGARVEFVRLPVRWAADASFYGDWVLTWHRELAGLGLDRFDLVVSDNLHEPLLYCERVVLSGSFLWPDVLHRAFPESPVLARYRESAEHLLLERRPEMIVNRYFAMPATGEWAQAVPVGFIGFCDERIQARRGPPRRVLLAVGKATAAEGVRPQIVRALRSCLGNGTRFLASPEWARGLERDMPGVQPFDFERGSLEEADFAIVRPGLGTISDCVLARVPMAVLPDACPEVAHNGGRLIELGLGVSLGDLEEAERSPLTNAGPYSDLAKGFDGLERHGEDAAARHLLSILGGSSSR
ncbi:MAG: hypothetical protein HYY13_04930 [Nitrospirae bacterium]|nr:hypothetical protein [Nitrospirota bacterium]